MIIDAKNTILGRLGSYVAKQVLLGEKVHVINCEEAVISGRKKAILQEYKKRMNRKAPGKAPYFYRVSDKLVKRAIRGMLPYKRARGRDAFKNLRCYIGVPDNLKAEGALILEKAGVEKLPFDYLKVKDICRALGGR